MTIGTALLEKSPKQAELKSVVSSAWLEWGQEVWLSHTQPSHTEEGLCVREDVDVTVLVKKSSKRCHN